jgi:hypothetical protein
LKGTNYEALCILLRPLIASDNLVRFSTFKVRNPVTQPYRKAGKITVFRYFDTPVYNQQKGIQTIVN